MDLRAGMGSRRGGIGTRFIYVALVVAALFALAVPALAIIVIDGKDIKNGTVTGKDIENGSLAKKELAFDAMDAAEDLAMALQEDAPMTVPDDRTTFTTIASLSMDHRGADQGIIVNWHVGFTNDTPSVTLLTYQVVVDGVVQEGSYEETAPAATSGISDGAIIIICKPGTHLLELQVQSAGAEVSIGTRSLEAVAGIISA